MNDLLIPKFKANFELTQFQANLVQSAFFGAYFLVSLIYFFISATKGDPIARVGYKNGLVIGLLISALGCFLFYPAAVTHAYPLFLAALFVLGSGITLIQIAANPYVSILGPESSAPSRLNLSQGLNSLGYVIAPLVGGVLLFGNNVYGSSASIESVIVPYIGLAIAFAVLALVFKKISLPTFQLSGSVEKGVQAFKHPHFVWGWLAIFFYVGSEVTVGSILINYLADPAVMGLGENSAAQYLSFYWGGLMIGRLMGAISLGSMAESKKMPLMILSAFISTLIIFANATFKEKLTHGTYISVSEVLPFVGMVALSFLFFMMGRSSSGRMVGIFAIVASLLTAFSMTSTGQMALWSIVGIGLFNSIMWSNIFTLAIKGLGKHTSQGSSLLVMMIVGGALLPALQGAVMDQVGVRISLAVVLLGYVYLSFFGFYSSRKTHA